LIVLKEVDVMMWMERYPEIAVVAVAVAAFHRQTSFQTFSVAPPRP
jgi:hypothetical protein